MSSPTVDEIRAVIQDWRDRAEAAINSRASRGFAWSGMLADRADTLQEVLDLIDNGPATNRTEQQ